MKRAVIIILFLIITITLFTFFFINNSTNNSNQSSKINLNPNSEISPEKTFKIKLTKNGFEPKEITITPNTKVVWTNESGKPATVDSNPHPIHTDHNELNLGEFKNGDNLELVFIKTGEFKFHNHYKPEESGSIIVK